MKTKKKIYLFLIIVILIIILSILVYSYYTYEQITFYIIFLILIFGPISIYAIIIEVKSKKTHWVYDYTRGEIEYTKHGDIDSIRDEESYFRIRREKLRDERAKKRNRLKNEKEIYNSSSNLSVNNKHKPPKFK